MWCGAQRPPSISDLALGDGRCAPHHMVYHAHGALQGDDDADQALIDRVEKGTLRPNADGHFLEYIVLDIARDDHGKVRALE